MIYLVTVYVMSVFVAQTAWCLTSFFLLELLHEVVYPVTDDRFGGSARSFSGMMKLICIVVSGFSFLILYQTIIKHATFVNVRRKK